MAKRVVVALLLLNFATLSTAAEPASANANAIREAVKLYASFDEQIVADVAGGDRNVMTRSDDPANKGQYVARRGFPQKAFTIETNSGIAGGALSARDVLPNRGRLFFPAAGNIPYRPEGWSGSASCWLKTNPDTQLKTPFCDPIQVTERSAGDGGLWIDFPKGSPRKLRLGAFRALSKGERAVKESAVEAPLIVVPKVGFLATDWHHVAFTWSNFDSRATDAKVTLYIDGKKIGALEDRDIAMRWDVEKAGIYFAVNYIGLMDELAIFDRELSIAEIQYIHQHPACLAATRN